MSKKGETITRRFKVIASLIASISFVLPLFLSWGCANVIEREYIVTFDSNGGTPVASVSGTVLEQPITTCEGRAFVGWYENADFSDDEPTSFPFAPTKDTTLYAKWQNLSLPIVSISLNGGFPLSSITKEEYVDGAFSVSNAAEAFKKSSVKMQMRGRGNSSWNLPKKSYKLKFAATQSLFGEAASKHWVLHSNNDDQSLMRHRIAYSICKQILDGIEYTTSQHTVDLYVNDVYQGVYTIYEQIRVEDGRLNFKSEYNVLDTGYLVEMNQRIVGTSGVDYFHLENAGNKMVEMKSPAPDEYLENNCTRLEYEQQVNFIRQYLKSVHEVAINKQFYAYCDLADIRSSIDMYIIQEYYKNIDAGAFSFYYYKKPSGKLYFGPPWDFDYAAGNKPSVVDPTGIFVGNASPGMVKNYCELLIALMKMPEFVSLVKARWQEVSTSIKELVQSEISEVQAFKYSYEKNAQLWNSGDWLDGLNSLKTWLLARADWLDGWAAE